MSREAAELSSSAPSPYATGQLIKSHDIHNRALRQQPDQHPSLTRSIRWRLPGTISAGAPRLLRPLEETRWNKTAAASGLGLTFRSLRLTG